jgi:hypothetical protein
MPAGPAPCWAAIGMVSSRCSPGKPAVSKSPKPLRAYGKPAFTDTLSVACHAFVVPVSPYRHIPSVIAV